MHQQNLFNPIDDQKNNDQFKNWCKDLIAETLSNKFKLDFLILILFILQFLILMKFFLVKPTLNFYLAF